MTQANATPRRRMSLARRDELSAYLFIAPQFLGLLCFILVPVFFSLYISFTNWDMMSPVEWVGTQNYVNLFTGKDLSKVLGNTLQYVVMFIPLTIFFSLILALALNTSIKGVSLYRTGYFLPNITSSVAVSLVWLWIYNPDFGILNILMDLLGLPQQKFLKSLTQAMPSVVVVSVWQSVGYYMVLLLASLKGIDPTYYEAAKIDGASWGRSFRHITMPMLSPTLFFILTMGFINGFQVFNEVYMLTEGGPANSTKTMVMHIYNTAFKYFRMGEACVLAWVLFVIILIVTMVQFKLQNKWVNYDV